MTDLRYPNAVSVNIVRALRKRADELAKKAWRPISADTVERTEYGLLAHEFRSLADEIEAGTEDKA